MMNGIVCEFYCDDKSCRIHCSFMMLLGHMTALLRY